MGRPATQREYPSSSSVPAHPYRHRRRPRPARRSPPGYPRPAGTAAAARAGVFRLAPWSEWRCVVTREEMAVAVILGLLVNEATDICPWLAIRLVRWAVRRHYPHAPER